MIRILVAEDSASARTMLVKVLASDPQIRVVGQAKDGVEAIEMTQKLQPDVVTMDIQMPRLGGLEATQEIMITAPTPIVIVTASTKIADIASSLDTLHVGALDVLSKPSMPGSPEFANDVKHLISVVKSMAKVRVRRITPPLEKGIAATCSSSEQSLCMAVTMTTSVGGPLALYRILSTLPGNFPTPILVSQHITPGFTPGLASWLDAASPLRVKIAQEGELLTPRTVYLAPDGQHLGISKMGTVALSVAPPINGLRPSGTYLFDSVCRCYGAAMIAVVLSGEGKDGLDGLKTVHEARGRVIAQDQGSSVIFDMPEAAISEGLADEILPLEVISTRLIELV